MASRFPAPVTPEPKGPPEIAWPIPAPPEPRRSLKPSPWFATGPYIVAGMVISLMLWALTNRESAVTSGQGSAQVRTAVATFGEFTKTLRIGGTVETLRYAAIRAPKLRDSRDYGSAQLTLAKLEEPGTVLRAAVVAAEFEVQWLLDRIKDRESVQTVVESNANKRAAQIAIQKETRRQARLAAKGRAATADLDVSTAAVRSKIEAEILRNVAQEAHARWQQLEQEGEFREIVYRADLRKEQLRIREQELRLERLGAPSGEDPDFRHGRA